MSSVDHTLSDTDISRMMSNQITGQPLKWFGGCFLSDELKNMAPEQGKGYIINLGNSKEKNPDGSYGTHWEAIYNGTKSSIIFFDSFGLLPNEDTLAFLKRAKDANGKRKRVLYNTLQYQDLDSTACGYFAVYVLRQLKRNRSFLSVLYDFDAFKKWYNDRLVEKINKQGYIDSV